MLGYKMPHKVTLIEQQKFRNMYQCLDSQIKVKKKSYRGEE